MSLLTIKTNNGFDTTAALIRKPPYAVLQSATWQGTGLTYDSNGNITSGMANKVDLYDALGSIQATVKFSTPWDVAKQGVPQTTADLLVDDSVMIGGAGDDTLSGGSNSGVYQNGHSYSLSISPEGRPMGRYNYFDDTDTQLTDGILGNNDWEANLGNGNAYEWIGWYQNEPTINFTFDQSVIINRILIGFNHSEGVGIYLPTDVTINEKNFSLTGNEIENGKRGVIEFDGVFTGSSINISLTDSNNNRWIFVDEIQFISTTSNTVFKGGKGNDTYIIDSAGDKIIESPDQGMDSVNSSIIYKLPANVENLTLTGTEALNGSGNNLNNHITGNSAADVLVGLAGDDCLEGGLGNDTLMGGSGADTAIYSGISSDYQIDYKDKSITITDTNTSDGDDGVDVLTGVERLQFANNQLVHTGALFAILSYGEYSLWADQANATGWAAYSGTEDEGFDDNYQGFFNNTLNLDEKWTLLTDADNQLGAFGDNNAHAAFTKFTDQNGNEGGGLYHGYVDAETAQTHEANGIIYGNSNALVATNGDTLVLAFRGTDGKDKAVSAGQAYTGEGSYNHYQAFKPLIDKVFAYAQNADNHIQHIVVSGHSLGGAMTDIFTAVDGKRFNDLPNSNLTVVAIASPGLVPSAFNDDTQYFGKSGYDHSVITSFTLGFPNLSEPNFYNGFAHNQDRVFYPIDNFAASLAQHLTPTDTLTLNTHFKITHLNLPNVGNTDVNYHSSWTDDALDHGFGAHHNGLIYYKDLDGLYSSPLLNDYTRQNLIFGVGSYTNSSAWFEGSPVDDLDPNGIGDRRLMGTNKADFIIGHEGNDVLNGKKGDDLLDGCVGDDTLNGGAGSDKMAGGLGSDIFVFEAEADSAVGKLRDVITDFLSGTDKIDLSEIDANSSTFWNNAFDFIGNKANSIEKITQLRFADGILSGNTSGDTQPEFEITLTGVTSLNPDTDLIL